MPTDWPNPPLLEHILFENPWPLVIFFLAIAAALFVVGGRLEKIRMQRSALFPLLGAIAVPLIANAVHTDREQLAERTQALVDAVAREPIDAAAMSGLLDENVTFFLMNRDQIIAMAQRASAKYNIQAGSITALEARVDAPDAGQIWFAIYVRIRSDGGEFPTKSQWLLHWRKSAGLWRVSEIQMISVNDQPARKAYLP